jgi:hypothetical protein
MDAVDCAVLDNSPGVSRDKVRAKRKIGETPCSRAGKLCLGWVDLD